MKERKKSWNEKCKLVHESFLRIRVKDDHKFAKTFYDNLFFLNKDLKNYFKNTDFVHQEKALMHGLTFLTEYTSESSENARSQVKRLAYVHNKDNLNIHPHLYYYWVEALIITVKKEDNLWHDDLEYYWREVIFMPVSFFISQYFLS